MEEVPKSDLVGCEFVTIAELMLPAGCLKMPFNLLFVLPRHLTWQTSQPNIARRSRCSQRENWWGRRAAGIGVNSCSDHVCLFVPGVIAFPRLGLLCSHSSFSLHFNWNFLTRDLRGKESEECPEGLEIVVFASS